MRKESRRSHSVRAFTSLHRIACRVAAVVSLLVSTAPLARAQQPDALKFFKNYFVTGDMIVGGTQFGSASVNGKTKAIINMAGAAAGSDALAAFLYWQTDESSETPAGSVGLFDGHKIVGIQIGDKKNPGCNAKYGRVYRADVLRHLEIDQVANLRKPNGSHTIALTDSGNGRVRPNGATLVIVYRIVVPGKPTIAPLRALVAYDGAFTTTLGPMRQTIGGFYDASSSAARMVDIAAYQQGGFTVKVN